MTDKKIIDTYVGNKPEEVVKSLKKPANKIALEQGALQKNNYTYALEALITRFLQKQNDPTSRSVEFNIDNDKLMAIMDGREYDVSEIIKHANLNHLEFTPEDFDNFMYFIHNGNPEFMPFLDSAEGIPTMEDYEKREKEGLHPDGLKELSLAEKTAINIYTGPFYIYSNSLLRGNLNNIDNDSKKIGEILATLAMCCSGLNKATVDVPQHSTRFEENFSEELTQKRIKAVENGGYITQEMGFFSTAVQLNDEAAMMYGQMLEEGMGTGIILSDLHGKYVGSISQKPNEAEFLIPPTQVRWLKHHQTEKGGHVFYAKPVNTLTGLTEEQRGESEKARQYESHKTERRQSSVLFAKPLHQAENKPSSTTQVPQTLLENQTSKPKPKV